MPFSGGVDATSKRYRGLAFGCVQPPLLEKEGIKRIELMKTNTAIEIDATTKSVSMKAIAVRPGIPGSMHLADLGRPSLTEIPNGRGVLVKVLHVGVDGTD